MKVEKVRAIYKVVTDRGMFGFKGGEELGDLLLVADRLSQLRMNGFSRAPEFVPTVDGELLIHEGGHSYFLERWIDAAEVPKHSYAYLPMIGRALARFHEAGREIAPPPQGSARYEWGIRKAFLERAWGFLSIFSSVKHISSIEQEILDYLSYRCALAYRYIRDLSWDQLLMAEPDAIGWCHGGLHHKNIMIDRNADIWFIDFETMTYCERVMDLAQLLQYHAITYQWNPDVVLRFLAAYTSELAHPIHPDEWRIFHSYLAFPRRFYNRMLRYFQHPDRPREHLLKLLETIESERWKDPFLHANGPPG